MLRPAVLQALAEDPTARALYLFPTKALSQDQLASFRELAGAADIDINAGVYDGDTPVPIRTLIRTAGQVVVTNPDMLHSAILPHHTKWFQLFEQLRYVVIDEAHTYRGIFGSHVANVIRRLLRLCEHYGARPQFIFCSATIGNPQALAETLLGRPWRWWIATVRRQARSTSLCSTRPSSTSGRASGPGRWDCHTAPRLRSSAADGRQSSLARHALPSSCC